MDEQRRRLKYIDVLKIVSSFCIVLLHVNSSSLHKVQNDLTQFHCNISFAIHQLLYLSVPIFMILTGCGLFSSGKTDYKSMRPKIQRLILCIVIFGFLFSLLRIVVLHETRTLRECVISLLSGTSMSHMWYLNKLLGLYLLAPLFGGFIQKCSRRNVAVLSSICLFFSSFLPHIGGQNGVAYAAFFPINGMFVPCALVGYLIETERKEVLQKYRIVFLIGAVTGAGLMALLAMKDPSTIFLEDSPIGLLTSICIVFSAKGFIHNGAGNNIKLETASRCTLGIYIIHPLFIQFLLAFSSFNPHLHVPIISVPITALMCYICSFAIVITGMKLMSAFRR